MTLTIEAGVKSTPKRLTRRNVWIITGSGILLTIAAVLVGYPLDFYGYDGQITSWSRPLFDILPMIAAFVVGGLIASRLPNNIYGWIWLVLGWAIGVFLPWSTLIAFRAYSVVPAQTVVGGIANQVAALSWLVGIPMIAFCLLYFPNGRLPSHRWRWVVWSIFVATIVAALTTWAVPENEGVAPLNNPFGDTGDFGLIATLVSSISVVYIVLVTFPLAFLSLIFRYRQAKSPQQAQLRWFLFMAALTLIFLAIDIAEIHNPWVSEDFMTNFLNVLLTGLPAAVAIAIFRYHLYDIDVIIRKTAVYSLLTAVLAILYFGIVVMLQTLVEPFIGSDSPLVIVFSTLLIAVFFSRLRRRVQSFIDRRFYRRKYDAVQTVAQFVTTIRDEVELDQLTLSIQQAVNQTLQPNIVSVWVPKPVKNKR